jgi:D-alanine-D-alanine ligase
MKNGRLPDRHFSPDRKLPLNNIGVIYCTSSLTPKGREFEKMADCEVIEVAHAIQAALQPKGYQVQLVDLDHKRIAGLKAFDWIINLAETIYGYPFTDYEVAIRMERLKINFTGSGSRTLRACLDKGVTKAELMKHGIITPTYDVIYPRSPIFTKCSYPVIVKPVHEDGSIGISNKSIASNLAELGFLVQNIHHKYRQAALVEDFIEGRDITASILGNGEEAVVLPLSEITYPDECGGGFLTFAAKWQTETVEFQTATAKCPTILDPQVEADIKRTALQTYRIMGCRDYGRVDFRLRGEVPYVLEVNPNPCINPDDSGFVRCGLAAGYDYAGLIHQILMESLKNYYKVQALAASDFVEVKGK